MSNQWPLMQQWLFSSYLNITKQTLRSFSNVTATKKILVIQERNFHNYLWFPKKDLKNSKQRGGLFPQEDVMKIHCSNWLSKTWNGMWNKHRSAGGWLSRELLTVAICLLIRGAGNSNAVFERSCNALELHTFKVLEPARLNCFVRPPPCLSGHLNHHQKPICLIWQKYPVYESRHTEQQTQVTNQSSHSLILRYLHYCKAKSDIYWCSRELHGYISLYFTEISSDNTYHPLKYGFKSYDLLHLRCKLGWTVSEVTFAV